MSSSPTSYFYPRPPRGGRRKPLIVFCTRNEFLSTPSARRATYYDSVLSALKSISIHALREEGDRFLSTIDVSPTEFLSTPSARRATFAIFLFNTFIFNFYPRPPRGGRLAQPDAAHGVKDISIHALREEGDASASPQRCTLSNFYPRPPRGGRPPRRQHDRKQRRFLSTPSARRATYHPVIPHLGRPISIHALREEGDHEQIYVYQVLYDFYPRPPRGGRPFQCSQSNLFGTFLSTPSARRATLGLTPPYCCMSNFYPRPPRGGRQTINNKSEV